MAKFGGSKCTICRRERTKLFLKGERCMTEKCAFEKRNYIPGQHGKSRNTKLSDYGNHLREKQKVRRIYGVLERQFRNYFHSAERVKGITGENLLQFLERRLDNVVYRLGFAPSRRTARQLVAHGHFLINNRSLNIPSYLVRKGDLIQVKEKSRRFELIHSALKKMTEERLVSWLEVDKVKLSGTVQEFPKREDVSMPIQENLIVELYSK